MQRSSLYIIKKVKRTFIDKLCDFLEPIIETAYAFLIIGGFITALLVLPRLF